MRQRKNSNPFSLFAFQDIITAVSGIFIFLTLLLAMDLVNRVVKTNSMESKTTPKQSMEQIQKEMPVLRAQIENAQKILVKNVKDQEKILLLSEKELTEKNEELEHSIKAIQTESKTLSEQYATLDKERQQIPKIQEELELIQKNISKLTDQEVSVREKLDRYRAGRFNIFSRSHQYKEVPWIVDLSKNRINVLSLKQTEQYQFPNKDKFLEWAKTRDWQTEYYILVVRPSACSFVLELQESLKACRFKLGMELTGEREDIVVLNNDKELN